MSRPQSSGWLDALSNPQAIQAHWMQPPPLEAVEVHAFSIDGRTARLVFDIDTPPDHRARRWLAEANVVQIELDFGVPISLSVEGNPAGLRRLLTLRQDAGTGSIRLSLRSATSRLDLVSYGCRIARLTAYVREPEA